MVKVKIVHPDSIAHDLAIVPGTELLAVNGRAIDDFLDWEFHSADDHFIVLARLPDGETVEFDIERPGDRAMGLELEPPGIRRCANRCDFCFVDGLPEKMRDVLYIRDDDYRLSFRYGNFATLTNLKEKDLRRIIEYRLSPLYVSVHATDPVVRRRLLRNPLAPDIVEQMSNLAGWGIQFHTQIVLQPGVNDGAVLERSLTDLYDLGDSVLSASVVPVGLTEFSKHHLVREPTVEECRSAIEILEQFQERARRERSITWAFGSDELYMAAEVPLPPAEAYGEFEQVENGVGAVRFLEQRVAHASFESLSGVRVGVFTGTAMGKLMPQLLAPLEQATGAEFRLEVLVNTMFGERVSTAGLLPGVAFRKALEPRSDLDLALLPAEAVNDAGSFIDDVTLEELCRVSPAEIRLSYDFTDALSGSA